MFTVLHVQHVDRGLGVVLRIHRMRAAVSVTAREVVVNVKVLGEIPGAARADAIPAVHIPRGDRVTENLGQPQERAAEHPSFDRHGRVDREADSRLPRPQAVVVAEEAVAHRVVAEAPGDRVGVGAGLLGGVLVGDPARNLLALARQPDAQDGVVDRKSVV